MRIRKKKSLQIVVLFLLGLFSVMNLPIFMSCASAAESSADIHVAEIEKKTNSSEEQVTKYQELFLQEFDFREIDQMLNQMFPSPKMSFSELVEQLLSGDTETMLGSIKSFMKERLFYSFRYHKAILAQMIVIALFSAFFQNFSMALKTKQLSNSGFYVLYMILLVLSIHSFEDCVVSLTEGMNQLLQFMRVLCPSFFMSVAIAVGASSSLIFYNVLLFFIYVIEWGCLNVLFPAVHIYIMILFLNYLTEESYLTQMAELIEKIISNILKTVLILVMGVNMMQGMILPVLDFLKRDVVVKTTANIPGVGDVLSNGTELLLGVAVLFKNCIGVGGMMIILILSIGPILELGIVSFFYKAAAAFMQPVADKRIVGCISSMSEGCNLLLKIQFTMTLLFLLALAMILTATVKAY